MSVLETCQKHKGLILCLVAWINLILTVVVLISVFTGGPKKCDTFPGSTLVYFLEGNGNFISKAFSVLDGAGSKQHTSEACQTNTNGEAKMWEITDGNREMKYFLKEVNGTFPDSAWEIGVWLDAIYEQGKLQWKSNPAKQDSFDQEIAQSLKSKGAPDGSCLIVKGQESDEIGILPVSCNSEHYGLCVKQCPGDEIIPS